MNTKAFQQELLLVSSSSHIQRPFCENSSTSDENATVCSKLEEACWNGLLEEFLPGMILKASTGRALWLWQINQMNACFLVDLCEVPDLPEKRFSIDPNYFLTDLRRN